ncbi:ankyrin repeat domain-containing protein [Candidatus Dependentiae bacterium]|nr:ankyrin repeat domain-containing protein [Candidatus Dependentiae bacterium]
MFSQTTGATEQQKINAEFLEAVRSGNINNIQAALDRGVNIKQVQFDALMTAVQNGNKAVLEFLLEKGFNPDLRKTWAFGPTLTPREEALRQGRDDVIEVLREHTR